MRIINSNRLIGKIREEKRNINQSKRKALCNNGDDVTKKNHVKTKRTKNQTKNNAKEN